MHIETKYSIGDTVYHPQVLTDPVRVPCPDCLGQRQWAAHLPNGEWFAISCETCTRGYETFGYIMESMVRGVVRELTVGSVEINTGRAGREVRYMCHETGVGTGTCWQEERFFATREEAEAALPGLVEAQRIGLAERLAENRSRKKHEGPGRMAAFYRAQIRAAKKEIAQAERGLEREKGDAG